MKIFSYPGVQFPSGFPKVEGSDREKPIRLKVLNEKHMQISEKPQEPEYFLSSFANSLNQMLGNVESLANQSKELTKKAIYDPDSVDIHEIMIASQKARFALNLTKTLTDGLVRAYRELTTPR